MNDDQDGRPTDPAAGEDPEPQDETAAPLKFEPAQAPPNGSARKVPGVCARCQTSIAPEAFVLGDGGRGIFHRTNTPQSRAAAHGAKFCGPIWTEFYYHVVFAFLVPSINAGGTDRQFLKFDLPVTMAQQIHEAERFLAAQIAEQFAEKDPATGHVLVGKRPEVEVKIMAWTPLDRR